MKKPSSVRLLFWILIGITLAGSYTYFAMRSHSVSTVPIAKNENSELPVSCKLIEQGQTLMQVDVYDGNPESMASLKPEGDTMQVWDLSGPSYQNQGYFLRCIYGETRTITVTYPLPKNVRECTSIVENNRAQSAQCS